MSLAASLDLLNLPLSSRIHLQPNTNDSTKKFLIPNTIRNTMIMICKGIQKDHRFEKCTFLYDGNWGDVELVEHQKYHKSLKDQNYFWLGFDISQSLGSFSGRDGKRT